MAMVVTMSMEVTVSALLLRIETGEIGIETEGAVDQVVRRK